ncbi:hypothetical protein R1sor_024035 [Riccia sorocarpa]|uniref:Uncharacterized protein n=1 Tax=Riccia sorocarpa TaxID=122646 RepID=A0ABD3GVB1_9MARC
MRTSHCVVVQTVFREEESQHLYSECRYYPTPEPESFIDGVGLQYLKISDKEVDPDCSSVCWEKEERRFPGRMVENTPNYMTRVVPSYSDDKSGLVYPHRNKGSLKQPQKKTLAEQYFILEPLHSLSYQGLEYLESCLSFESLLDKLETGEGDPSEARSRAVALRLLLRLPMQLPGELKGSPESSGNRTVHSRIHLSAKGKHHRVLTPRCDTTIIQQLGRNNAIVLLQKFLRVRANMISVEKTKARWEESYDELNGFQQCYKPEGIRSGMNLDTSITEKVIVRTLIGQFLGVILEPLVISMPVSPPHPNGRTTAKPR